MRKKFKIGVVVPSFKVSNHILTVIRNIPIFVDNIYVVDDGCPEGSGDIALNSGIDSRVKVIYHARNCGVGAAMITGYQSALLDQCDVVVKVDGDDQMDPALMWDFILPIISGCADYTKGNRFYHLEGIRNMPLIRILGNSSLSLMCKLSTGYWNIADPTNGYTAISSDLLNSIELESVKKSYYFEIDMLYQLYCHRALVVDIPMKSRYGLEKSSLRIRDIVYEFSKNIFTQFISRIYSFYFLRDINIASLCLLAGTLLSFFGLIFGIYSWSASADGRYASSGTVMLSGLPLILGTQFLLAFFVHDVNAYPKQAISQRFKVISAKP